MPSAGRAGGGGPAGAGGARAGAAYAVGTKPRRQSRTVARSVARPEASTPTCGYTGLPEAELPSRAVRDRSPAVGTRGYRFASKENNASYRRRYTQLLKSSFPSASLWIDDRSSVECSMGVDRKASLLVRRYGVL